MSRVSFDQLLQAGAHFGHLKRKWNPAMAPYIFTEKNGIHIIDLNKTVVKLDESAAALKQIARSGKKILFVATKKQAKDIVSDKVKKINMPYVTERWPGGMLTNFATIRKSIRKMASIDKMSTDGTFNNISKKEKLSISRLRAKLETQFGSIADLTRLPAAIFIVDIMKEHIAVAEAKRLNIPTFAIVDTNSDPNQVDYAIPANDDASTSIELIVGLITKAVEEGLAERKVDKDKEAEDKEAKSEIDENEEAKQAKRLELIAAGLDDENSELNKEKKKVVVAKKQVKKKVD
jgi:small subunit ribosomal protein S2